MKKVSWVLVNSEEQYTESSAQGEVLHVGPDLAGSSGRAGCLFALFLVM